MGDNEGTDARTEGYATGRATKQSIVERAAEAFGERGFYGTSLRSIAREAGVDHSTLLHHFGNKTALLLAVIEWHDTRSLPAFDTADITPEFITDAIVSTAERNRSVPGLTQLLSILTAEAASPEHPAREPLQHRHELLTVLIAWTIGRQRTALDITDDLMTPEERAAFIVATWDGLHLYDGLHPGVLDVPGLLRGMLTEAFGLDRGAPGGS
ncbi:TetR/AcrR family transcriptional regulator [Paraoerskovia marina]|uniref:TetR/AcrR family transcriptional regulator n=1 Tax=Paraoerskovia marina TaxID=545619 RepID=UPI000694571A|nr:TetR/AcrR family transcriptional regulator [Paraoerskovia marina]